MATPLQTFVDWNDDAVDFMEQGRANEAVAILRMALRYLKFHFDSNCDHQDNATDNDTVPVRKRSRQDSEGGSNSGAEGASDEVMVNHASILCSVQICKTKEYPDLKTSNSLFTFYPKAFKIDGSKPHLLEETKIMAVLLYNFTILRHIAAIEERQLGSGRFSHVLDMYRAALQFAASHHWDDKTSESMSWLVLAISNNIGFIHSNSDSLDFQETRDSLSKVATLLMTMATYQNHKVPHQEFRVFFESIFTFMDGSGLFVAPAA